MNPLHLQRIKKIVTVNTQEKISRAADSIMYLVLDKKSIPNRRQKCKTLKLKITQLRIIFIQ